MIVTTADVIPGQAVQVLGLVRGNIVTSKNIGRDLMAGMKSIVGGEIVSYTQMTDEARQVAEDRMVTAAQNLGADAVVAMRFASDSIAEGTIEILAYGTAVKLRRQSLGPCKFYKAVYQALCRSASFVSSAKSAKKQRLGICLGYARSVFWAASGAPHPTGIKRKKKGRPKAPQMSQLCHSVS